MYFKFPKTSTHVYTKEDTNKMTFLRFMTYYYNTLVPGINCPVGSNGSW